MTRNELNNLYFDWLCQIVFKEGYSKNLSYHKLMHFLHDTEFTYLLDMDGNRYEDGVDMRYRFGYEHNYPSSMIADYLDYRGCSVLEMLIALSIRLEEHIMDNPDVGNRTGQWFWNMIVNLGLHSMDDTRFDEVRANDIIRRFLDRAYEPDGTGGLFKIEGNDQDLRTVEIWYQACWYLNDVLRYDVS